MNPDGTPASDNPFFGSGGNARYVWSWGHRNPQGLAWDSRGQLWAAEFGENSQDELNLIQKGGNYGWPACEGTIGDCDGYIAPKRTWSTSQAGPSGIEIVNDWIYIADPAHRTRIPLGPQPAILVRIRRKPTPQPQALGQQTGRELCIARHSPKPTRPVEPGRKPACRGLGSRAQC